MIESFTAAQAMVCLVQKCRPALVLLSVGASEKIFQKSVNQCCSRRMEDK